MAVRQQERADSAEWHVLLPPGFSDTQIGGVQEARSPFRYCKDKESAAMKDSRHSAARRQQRGIPPLILQWLQDFGREQHDGHGCRIYWFDKRARRRIQQFAGREPVRRMHEWLDAYVVIDGTGHMVTVGPRYRRIWRP
jgi:hypothetical protein